MISYCEGKKKKNIPTGITLWATTRQNKEMAIN